MGKSKDDFLNHQQEKELIAEMQQFGYRRKGPKFQGLGPAKKRDDPEARIVRACVAWWMTKYQSVWRRFYMVNNDSAYNKYKGKKNQLQGVVAGTADHCLRLARRGWFGAYVEFKAPGGKQTDDQRIMQQECQEDGYLYVLIKGKTEQAIIEEFKKFIRWYMTGAPTKSQLL